MPPPILFNTELVFKKQGYAHMSLTVVKANRVRSGEVFIWEGKVWRRYKIVSVCSQSLNHGLYVHMLDRYFSNWWSFYMTIFTDGKLQVTTKKIISNIIVTVCFQVIQVAAIFAFGLFSLLPTFPLVCFLWLHTIRDLELCLPISFCIYDSLTHSNLKTANTFLRIYWAALSVSQRKSSTHISSNKTPLPPTRWSLGQ